MKRMANSEPKVRPETPARRAWVRPVLVEYGHLAKLTRGSSGAVSEFTTRKGGPKCL